MYKEKNLTSDFSAFLRKDPRADELRFSFAIEMKIKYDNDKLHLVRDFQPQQINALLSATTSKGIYHKISDQTMQMKPFDAFQLCNVPAFVGVCWYVPRKRKRLYLVRVGFIQELLDNNITKISETEVALVAKHTFDL